MQEIRELMISAESLGLAQQNAFCSEESGNVALLEVAEPDGYGAEPILLDSPTPILLGAAREDSAGHTRDLLPDLRFDNSGLGNLAATEFVVRDLALPVEVPNVEACGGCSACSACSGCSGCTGCSGCSGCTGCSACSGCSGCTGCSGCSGCSGCTGCSYSGRFQADSPAPMASLEELKSLISDSEKIAA